MGWISAWAVKGISGAIKGLSGLIKGISGVVKGISGNKIRCTMDS